MFRKVYLTPFASATDLRLKRCWPLLLILLALVQSAHGPTSPTQPIVADSEAAPRHRPTTKPAPISEEGPSSDLLAFTPLDAADPFAPAKDRPTPDWVLPWLQREAGTATDVPANNQNKLIPTPTPDNPTLYGTLPPAPDAGPAGTPGPNLPTVSPFAAPAPIAIFIPPTGGPTPVIPPVVVGPTSIPEPTGLWLAASALLVLHRRRRC